MPLMRTCTARQEKQQQQQQSMMRSLFSAFSTVSQIGARCMRARAPRAHGKYLQKYKIMQRKHHLGNGRVAEAKSATRFTLTEQSTGDRTVFDLIAILLLFCTSAGAKLAHVFRMTLSVFESILEHKLFTIVDADVQIGRHCAGQREFY